jgi:DNA-binding NtrC family response regulator
VTSKKTAELILRIDAGEDGRVEIPFSKFVDAYRRNQSLFKRTPWALKEKPDPDPAFVEDIFKAGLLTADPFMLDVLGKTQTAAKTKAPLLILGETGTGKELVAKYIHAVGQREGELVAVNCAQFSPETLKDELFGHVKGAFTGANKDKEGLVAVAEKGTLFFDEIGDMPLDLQASMLRFLDNGEYRRLGEDDRVRMADVRIIAATNKDLMKAVGEGTFREDLYYRLATETIELPPLRLRPGDIPLLVCFFIERFNQENDASLGSVSKAFLCNLIFGRFDGNIRELQSLVGGECRKALGKGSEDCVGREFQGTKSYRPLYVLVFRTESRGNVEVFFELQNETIALQDLLSFDLAELMVRYDEYFHPDCRNLWQYEPRKEWLELEENQAGPAVLPQRDVGERDMPEMQTEPTQRWDEDALLAKIYDRPADDLKRDYANWLLEKYGNPNAAATRAGIESRTITSWANTADTADTADTAKKKG